MKTMATAGYAHEGEALPIYVDAGNGKHKLLKENLERILLRDDVRNTPLMVLSVAGGMREGKSFILNFFIKYLKSGRSENWLQDQDSNLNGFTWKGGINPDTMGILMWSEPFHVPIRGKDKVAILLVDTQGAFDNSQSMEQTSRIFTMSLVLSSLQVYNVMRSLRMDKLQYFEVFIEHARASRQSLGQCFFQSLLFLIRDWSSEVDHEYGLRGGDEYVMKQLSAPASRNRWGRDRLAGLQQVFSSIRGFLMPEPGRRVSVLRSGEEAFTGALRDIDEEFVSMLPELTKTLFDDDAIVVKSFAGQVVTGNELLTFALAFAERLNRADLPQPMDILKATIQAHNANTLERFAKKYRNCLEQVVTGHPFVEDRDLKRKGEEVTENLLSDFQKLPYIGGDQNKKETLESMKKQFDLLLEACRNRNKARKAKLKEKYDQVLSDELALAEKRLQEQFKGKCVKESQISEACDARIGEIMLKLSEKRLGCKAFDEEFFQNLTVKMEKLRQYALTENSRMECHFKNLCAERISSATEKARQIILQELEEKVFADEKELSAILNHVMNTQCVKYWNQGLEISDALFQEYDSNLRQKIMAFREMIIKRNEENKKKFEAESFLTVEKLVGRYNAEMQMKLGKRSWSPEQLQNFHRDSCKSAKKALADFRLVSYTRKKCNEIIDSRLQDEYEKMSRLNTSAKEDFIRQCQLELSTCYTSAANTIRQKCTADAFEQEEIQSIYKECRENALSRFANASLEGPKDVKDMIFKQLGSELENLLEEAQSMNKKNQEAMQLKVWDVLKTAKHSYRAEMEKVIMATGEAFSDKEMEQKHEACKIKVTNNLLEKRDVKPTFREKCMEKLDEVLSSEFLKFLKENQNKRDKDEQKVKEILRECLAIYDKYMEKVGT